MGLLAKSRFHAACWLVVMVAAVAVVAVIPTGFFWQRRKKRLGAKEKAEKGRRRPGAFVFCIVFFLMKCSWMISGILDQL